MYSTGNIVTTSTRFHSASKTIMKRNHRNRGGERIFNVQSKSIIVAYKHWKVPVNKLFKTKSLQSGDNGFCLFVCFFSAASFSKLYLQATKSNVYASARFGSARETERGRTDRRRSIVRASSSSSVGFCVTVSSIRGEEESAVLRRRGKYFMAAVGF